MRQAAGSILTGLALILSGTDLFGQVVFGRIGLDRGDTLIGVAAGPAASVVLGLQGSTQSELRSVHRNGRVLWKRTIPNKLFTLESSPATLLAGEVGEEEITWHFLDSADGSVRTTARGERGTVVTLSTAGDAYARFANSAETPDREWEVVNIATGERRRQVSDSTVGAVVALNFQRVLVLNENGRLSLLSPKGSIWSTQVGHGLSLDRLAVSADARTTVVALYGGAFKALDVDTGKIIYEYVPSPNPAKALSQVGLLEPAQKASRVTGRPISQFAMNLQWSLAATGNIIAMSGLPGLSAVVRIDPRTGISVRHLDLDAVNATLKATGGGVLKERRSLTDRVVRFIADERVAVVTTESGIFLVSSIGAGSGGAQ